MTKTPAIIILIASAVLAQDRTDHVLLLAHFNKNANPDVGYLSGEITSANGGVTSGRLGYPFKDSRPSSEGLDMRKQSARIEFPITARSFHAAEGTVEFWYQHALREDLSKGSMVLFRVMFEQTPEPEHRFEKGDQFLVIKSDANPNIKFEARSVKAGVSWKAKAVADVSTWRKDQWHFIAVTWRGRDASIYLDGRLAGEGEIVPPTSKPKSILLGATFWGHDPEGIYDELRILSKAASAEQVFQDYERGAVDKLEFPRPKASPRKKAAAGPETPTDTVPLVVPYQATEPQDATGPGLQLLDDNFTAVFTNAPPTLDGRLDDPAWKSVPQVTHFIRRTRDENKAVEAQTHVQFLYDQSYLYVAVRLDEPNMKLLRRMVVDQRDQPVFRDDCFELLFDTSSSADTFYHFAINANATIADLRAQSISWSSQDSKAKTSLDADGWNIELAISFKDLGVTPRYGEIWGARMCRERYALVEKGSSAEQSSLPESLAGFGVYQNLGKLRFASADEATQPVHIVPDGSQRARLGMNVLSYKVTNHAKEVAELEFEARAVDRNNMLLSRDRVVKRIAPGGEVSVTLKVPVTTDAMQAISVTVYDKVTKKYVFGLRLDSEIAPVQPSLAEARITIPQLRACMALLPTGYPVVKTVKESVARIQQHLNVFEEALDAAVKADDRLAEEHWLALRRELAGFGDWLGKYRIVAWPDDLWANGLPSSFPAGTEKLEGLAIEMAGNEHQAASFSLTGLAVPGRLDVQVVITDLHSQENPGHRSTRRLPTNNIHIYWAAPFRDELRKVVADPLVRTDGNIFTVTTGSTLKLWVMVSSQGVEPGVYKGQVLVRPLDTLESAPDRWVRFPISVTVWPFELPRTEDNPLDAFLWGGAAYKNVYLDPVEVVRDHYDHRVNWVMADWYAIADRSSAKRFSVFSEQDLDRLKPLFQQAKQRGMKVMFAWNSPKAEAVPGIVEYMHKMGFADNEFASMTTKDEFGIEYVPKMLEYHKKVAALGVPFGFMTTYGSEPPYGATLAEIAPLTKYINIWFNHKAKWWPPSAKGAQLIAFEKDRGLKVGSYQCGTPMRVQPLVDYYRLYPWKAWKVGITSVAYCCFTGSTTGDMDFWDAHHGDQAPQGLVYIAAGGRINPSKRYEAFREGMEDYCYLWILQKRIDAARKRSQPVAEAEKVLAISVETALAAQTMNELDIIRHKLAEQIIKLSLPE